jgi:hypothetical protein
MSCECLDVVRRRAVNEMRSPTSPSLAVKNSGSPKGWSQKWAHELSTTANHSEISTSKAHRGLPWAQGAAGSNPAAPTNKISHHRDFRCPQQLTVGTPWEQPDRGTSD